VSVPEGLGGLGRVLMVVGGLVFVVGVVVSLLGRTGLGRLPGDIVVQRGGFTFYFPIVTSVLLSLLLTALLWRLRR
jgi:hypothetical protein